MNFNCLFYNIKSKDLSLVINEIVFENNIKMLFLCEDYNDPNILLHKLNKFDSFKYIDPISYKKNGLSLYVSSEIGTIELIQEGERFRCYMLYRENLKILVCAVHIQSKLYSTEDLQSLDANLISEELYSLEKIHKSNSTIIVGDFNMNPFEKGMMKMDCFNCVFEKNTALKGIRIYREKEFPLFYNPMINHFNEYAHIVPGSYYYRSNRENSLFWHVFDQVIFRGDIIKEIQNEDVEIIYKIKDLKLINEEGLPDISIASDHLPLKFKMR